MRSSGDRCLSRKPASEFLRTAPGCRMPALRRWRDAAGAATSRAAAGAATVPAPAAAHTTRHPDRMADRLQVHAQLVRAAGDGLQLQPRASIAARQHVPARGARPASGVIHFLQRAVRPVARQRQVDHAVIPGHVAGDDRFIALVDVALGEGAAQEPLHVQASRHDEQARRGHVEPVHDQRVGPQALRPRRQAILLVLSAPGHRQQARRFLQHQQLLVDVDQAFRQSIHESAFLQRRTIPHP